MTTLGEILSQLQDRTQVYQILMESGNLALMARLDQKAAAEAFNERLLLLPEAGIATTG